MSLLQGIEPLKEYFDKKQLENQIREDVMNLKNDLNGFMEKINTQGSRIKTPTALKQMLEFLKRLRPLKIKLVEYCKLCSPPSEKAEVKELLYSLDSVIEAILELESPLKLKNIDEDVRLDGGLRSVARDQYEQIIASLKTADLKKYPKKYFENMKIILKEIYDIGRPYAF